MERDRGYYFPGAEINLDEVAGPSPIFDQSEGHLQSHEYVEDVRSHPSERRESGGYRRSQEGVDLPPAIETTGDVERELSVKETHISEWVTKLYTVSYLIMFAMIGTLARVVIETFTFYPGAPVGTSALWANVAGSFIMGFLSEDRQLFRTDGIQVNTINSETENEAIWKAHVAAHKKTIPLYIGLTTGFCGCLTSFSTFMRDAFLAISNDLPSPLAPYSELSLFHSAVATADRISNGGFSVMAVLAVLITEIGLSVIGLFWGAHLAILTSSWLPTIQPWFLQGLLDPLTVVLAPLSWIVLICVTIVLPHVSTDLSLWSPETWRGPFLFSLVFAPVGCLLRFFLSLKLNRRIPSFPLGTFVVNVGGTAILGMAFSLQHASISLSSLGGGGFTGCQVLQGIMDGFCGCLTTVSTWVLELTDLKRHHACFYGSVSVATALAMLVVEIGTLRWTRGFATPACFT
jgi:CrcB protein